MRRMVEAWVDSFSNRLPDLRGVPRQKQAAIGLGVSVLIHVALFFLIALVAWLVPDEVLGGRHVQAEPEEKELEIELVGTPELLLPPVRPEWKAPKLIPLQADGLRASEAAPEKPVFESSQNMVAGSERAGRGSDPVPSQEGKALPFRQFKDQAASLGMREGAAQEAQRMAPGVPGSAGGGAAESGGGGGGTEAVVGGPDETDALLIPSKGEEAVVGRKPGARERAGAGRGEGGDGGSPGQEAGGYAPELHRTRVEGSISNRGPAGMDAVKTPMGVYRQQVCMQIGSRWEYHRRKRMDLIAIGTVRVRFYVTREGRIQGLKVVECSSNRTFAEVCERSVREAEIAPPPAEVDLMNDGRMEMVFTFTIF